MSYTITARFSARSSLVHMQQAPVLSNSNSASPCLPLMTCKDELFSVHHVRFLIWILVIFDLALDRCANLSRDGNNGGVVVSAG